MRMLRTMSCVTLSFAIGLTASVGAQAEPRDHETVSVGPWTIATTYKANKFDNCTMSRSAGDLGITFVRAEDGLSLVVDSPKWKLERGKAYPIRLIAGAHALEAKALAETRSVTVALADRPFNARLRSSSVLQVQGEGATLRLPLDRSSAALERLDVCFEKNSRDAVATNPFVARTRSP